MTESARAKPSRPEAPPGSQPSEASDRDRPDAAPALPDTGDDDLSDPLLGLFGEAADASRTTRPAPRNPATLMAELALGAALGAAGRRLLRAGSGTVVLIQVPNAAWVDPVAAVVERDAAAGVTVLRGRAKARDRESLAQEVNAAVTRGRLVVGIATGPEQLPRTLRSAADFSVALTAPDVALVRRAIRRFTGRSAVRFSARDIAGLDLDEIAAAMRPGSGPAAIVARLRRAAASSAQAPGDGGLPPLERLSGYGEAHAWAMDLVVDFARLRAGELRPGELEGAIFSGIPGTGKSTLARALARAAGAPLITTSVAEWIAGSSYLESVLSQANAFFDACLAQAPSIGFIDECDALPNRSALQDRDAPWWGTVLTNVLLRIDGLRSSGKGCVLIAATNHIERLDSALLRPGRFDRNFVIAPPDEAALATILRNHLGPDLAGADLSEVARLGLGGTGADAVGWIRAARRRARREERALALDDLLSVMRPPETRPSEFLRAVALHEAGHAIAATRLGLAVERVSVEPRGAAAGWTQLRRIERVPTRALIEAQVTEILAGRAADILLGTGAHAGASADLRMATNHLVALRAAHGLDATLSFRDQAADAGALLARDHGLARSVEAHLQRLMRVSLALVADNRAAILNLADRLLERRVMTGAEVEAVARAHPASGGEAPPAPNRLRQTVLPIGRRGSRPCPIRSDPTG